MDRLKEIVVQEAKKAESKTQIILELLKQLQPVIDDTATTLANEIIADVSEYYINDVAPKTKTYTYTPKEDYLEPYNVEVPFMGSNNGYGLGYADENYIEVKYLNKDSREYQQGNSGFSRLKADLYHIIKHECSHFYLKIKGLTDALLYYSHPDGLKKYYEDDQEMVLHSREIFDRLVTQHPSWKTMDNDKLIRIIANNVKSLPGHTNIPAPFGVRIQAKYAKFIMNNYVIPNRD